MGVVCYTIRYSTTGVSEREGEKESMSRVGRGLHRMVVA